MSTPSVWLTTLGCAKNQVDSEKVLAMLGEAGYVAAADPGEADVVMVNTCAFIEEARQESVEAILDVRAAARDDARTVVIGCMAQRFGVEVSDALPEVDAVLGLDRYPELVETLDGLTGWRPVEVRRRPVMDILHVVERSAPDLPYAYVKVAEGCDKPCTFCAIPLIRGRQRSRSPVNIRDEVASLARGGVSEVVLVAQDLAAYGRDIDAPSGPGGPITDLLRFVSDVDGVERFRLLYLYPREIGDELIDEMTSNPKIASYFDLSLQHATGRLLRAMKRTGEATRHLELIARIRRSDPQAATRSSFIVGFPGETESDVEELAEFLDEARLDWAGFFPYSAEAGTPAAEMEGRVSRSEIEDRLRHLQGIQEEITADASLGMIGREVDVLVDQVEDGIAVGRSYREAPEIDGMIALDRGDPGKWVRAEVTGAFGSDLDAVVLE
jgi:ribosomal protein S12 methylthiotransferase